MKAASPPPPAAATFFDKTDAFFCIVSVTFFRISIFVESDDIVSGSNALACGFVTCSGGCNAIPALVPRGAATNVAVGFSVLILSL